MANLDTAIQRSQEALDTTPADHPNGARRLHSLGAGYHDRYRRTGTIADLDTAIQRFQEALDTTPADHPDQAGRLYSLGAGYHDRYRRTGTIADLNTAIQRSQEALDASTDLETVNEIQSDLTVDESQDMHRSEPDSLSSPQSNKRWNFFRRNTKLNTKFKELGAAFVPGPVKQRRKMMRRSSDASFGNDKIVIDLPRTPSPPLGPAVQNVERKVRGLENYKPHDQRAEAIPSSPQSNKPRSFFNRSTELEDVGVAVASSLVQQMPNDPSPITPVSAASYEATSGLLPDKPTYSLYPPPLRLSQTNLHIGQPTLHHVPSDPFLGSNFNAQPVSADQAQQTSAGLEDALPQSSKSNVDLPEPLYQDEPDIAPNLFEGGTQLSSATNESKAMLQNFRKTFEMIIIGPRDPEGVHLTAGLDTGIDFDVIDETFFDSLSLPNEQIVQRRGDHTKATWQIQWHIAEFDERYTTAFVVTDIGRKDVKAILGRKTIEHVGFYRPNAPIFARDLDELDDRSEGPSLTTGSTLSTVGSVEEVREATEDIAEFLLKDAVLLPLYRKALDVVKIHDFEKTIRKLLKTWATELRAEAQALGMAEQDASQFLRRRIGQMVSHMGMCLYPERRQSALRLHELATQKVSNQGPLYAFLTDEAVAIDAPKPDAASDSGSSESEGENPYLHHREQVKSFISKSEALVKLRERFRQFVLQRHFEVKSPPEAVIDPCMVAEVTSTPTLESLHEAENDKPTKLITEPRAHVLGNDLQQACSAYFNRCVRLMLRIAVFLELREKPLGPGSTRIRWTCVCGARLYDDFRGATSDSLDVLQRMLNKHQGTSRPTTSGSPVQAADHSGGPCLTPGTSSHSEACTAATTTTGLDGRDENIMAQSQGTEGLRRRGQTGTNLSTFVHDSTWVLPIYYNERYLMKVEHLSVSMDMSDMALFELIKKSYHKSKSTMQRLLAMRGVKDVSFVKFMHATREPDIHQSKDSSDNWPPKERCPPWDYEGCRTGEFPMISSVYLLHQWRNPTHSDAKTYYTHPRRLIEKVRSRIRAIRASVAETSASIPMTTLCQTQAEARPDSEYFQDEEASTGATVNHDSSGPQDPDASCYIFLRTPKKLGEKLEAADRATPEAWGLYFQEGFLLHHFLLIVLAIYIMATAAFGAYWCAEYGLVGPNSGAAAFAVSSWLIGLLSLLTTVMFKWAE